MRMFRQLFTETPNESINQHSNYFETLGIVSAILNGVIWWMKDSQKEEKLTNFDENLSNFQLTLCLLMS